MMKHLWPKGPFSRLGMTVLFVVVLCALYLAFWPTNIRPVTWVPNENPGLTGTYAENDLLSAARLVAPESGLGPEGVEFDRNGRLYTGLANGDIVRIDTARGQEAERVINTGGRPLGIQFDQEQNLIIADAFRGLLRLSPDGTLTVLADRESPSAIVFADDLDIHSDGSIWFSDASIFEYNDSLTEGLAGLASGRLLQHDPSTGETRTVLSDLGFANGVAFGPNEDYILVTETTRYRISRYWLKGPNAGETDIFLDGLPAMPDNITYNGDGVFWLALFAMRSRALDNLADRPWVRKVLSRLPRALLPGPSARGFVLGIDLDGNIVANFQDQDEGRSFTSAIEHENALYLGSLQAPGVTRFELQDP